MRALSTLVAVLAIASTGAGAGAQDDLLARAQALHRSVPLIDGHNDYPWALVEASPARDFSVLDIRQSLPKLMTDIPRLQAGGVGGQFWSVYVPASVTGDEAVRRTIEQIDVVHRMVRRYPDTFEHARTAEDMKRAFAAGRIGSLSGIEGGHSINSSLAVLRMMRALGAGYMTLTHSSNVPWADSATDEPESGGLSAFGEEVVREMNRLGMLVDLSHVSPETMADALRVTRAPVIFSHSSARAVAGHPRNVPDEILRQLPANGGVVMVTFVPGFIAPAAAERSVRAMAEQRRLEAAQPGNAAAVRAAMREWRAAHPEAKATLSMVADHIDHIRQVASIDHIGLGGDFDGIDTTVQGLEDVSKYPYLTAELLRRGYADEDVRKILGLNVLRVMQRAEEVAATLKDEPPSTAMPTN